MCSYMNLAVLALAASTISPALSAPTHYRVPRVDSNTDVDVFRRVKFPRFRRSNEAVHVHPSDDDSSRAGPPSDSENRPSGPLSGQQIYPPPPYPPPPGPLPSRAPPPPLYESLYPPTGSASGTAPSKRRAAALLALGDHGQDHGLDKRLGLSNLANSFFDAGTLTARRSAATSRGVSEDVPQEEVTAALSALGKRDVAPGDMHHLFSRMLDELD